jgi:hypothetical protein
VDDNSMAVALMGIFVSGVVLSILLFHVGRAWGDRIRHRVQPPAASDPARDGLVAELQELRRELAELGERMDFTERLLAKQREGQRIGPG